MYPHHSPYCHDIYVLVTVGPARRHGYPRARTALQQRQNHGGSSHGDRCTCSRRDDQACLRKGCRKVSIVVHVSLCSLCESAHCRGAPHHNNTIYKECVKVHPQTMASRCSYMYICSQREDTKGQMQNRARNPSSCFTRPYNGCSLICRDGRCVCTPRHAALCMSAPLSRALRGGTNGSPLKTHHIIIALLKLYYMLN